MFQPRKQPGSAIEVSVQEPEEAVAPQNAEENAGENKAARQPAPRIQRQLKPGNRTGRSIITRIPGL